MTETAKKVMATYEAQWKEVQTVLEIQGGKKELANFYVYLCAKDGPTKEMAKKLLLAQAFAEETKQSPEQYQGSLSIYLKIREKTRGRQDTYPADPEAYMISEAERT